MISRQQQQQQTGLFEIMYAVKHFILLQVTKEG